LFKKGGGTVKGDPKTIKKANGRGPSDERKLHAWSGKSERGHDDSNGEPSSRKTTEEIMDAAWCRQKVQNEGTWHKKGNEKKSLRGKLQARLGLVEGTAKKTKNGRIQGKFIKHEASRGR